MEIFKMFPVRCFTCNKVIGHIYEKYKQIIKKFDECEVHEKLGIKRICCKRMFNTHINTIDTDFIYDNLSNSKIKILKNYKEKKIYTTF